MLEDKAKGNMRGCSPGRKLVTRGKSLSDLIKGRIRKAKAIVQKIWRKCMANLKLSSPWQTFYREMEAMFEEDKSVTIVVKDEEFDKTVYLYVEGQDKADALGQILPERKEFGDVTVDIVVKPSNKKLTVAQLYERAFAGNPAFSFAKTLEGVFTNPLHFVVFRNKTVQFWNDDIGDIYGNCTTLYQEIAKDIFPGEQGELYCTDKPDNLGVAMSKAWDDRFKEMDLPWQ